MSALDDKLNLHSGGCATYHESPCDCLTARARSELTALRARVAALEAVDYDLVRSAFLVGHVSWRPSDHEILPEDGGPIGRGIEMAVAEIRRQLAEHEKGGAT